MNRKKFIKQSGLSLLSAGLTPYLSMANPQNNLFSSYKTSKPKPQYDVIIIGGSFAGLSAALTLARCLRTVLVVDAGKNRNRFSKQANNALALDGKTPKSIISNSIDQLNKYEKYLDLLQDSVIDIERKNNEFTITTTNGLQSNANKIVFATGAVDQLPSIKGLQEQWGKNVHHCPYCDGFETFEGNTILIAHQFQGLELLPSLKHWCSNLQVCFNGMANIPEPLTNLLNKNNIKWHNEEIIEVVSKRDGTLNKLIYHSGKEESVNHIYIQPSTTFQINMAVKLGCKTNSNKQKLTTNEFMETSEKNIYAIGDIAAQSMEQIVWSINSGLLAAIHINRGMINEKFIY